MSFLSQQIRQVAYEYNNCGDDGWLKEMGRNYIYNQRKVNLRNYHQHTKECEKMLDWRNAVADKCVPFERTSFVGLDNSSKVLYNTVRSKNKVEYCERVIQPYESSFMLRGFPTSIIDSKNDLRSSENILKEWKQIHCKMVNLSKKIRPRIFHDPILEKVFSITTLHRNS